MFETVEEFLKRGGQIEKLEEKNEQKPKVVGNVTKKQVNIMTLAEGELYFAEKGKRDKKVKVADYSDINFDLIPAHLRDIIKPAPQQEDIAKGENK